MSWSVAAVGKAPLVAAEIASQFARWKCSEPEESVRQAVGAAIAAALAAQHDDAAVEVSGSGCMQLETGADGKVTNSLSITVKPLVGFLE